MCILMLYVIGLMPPWVAKMRFLKLLHGKLIDEESYECRNCKKKNFWKKGR
jgi:hypothetical protein